MIGGRSYDKNELIKNKILERVRENVFLIVFLYLVIIIIILIKIQIKLKELTAVL
uniref:Uncharacterized protein n=1 Tax=Bartonella rochalimae ATCC BAA-1498 TaxID=685782 RepID=E6YM98_9HYPH|nr:hypothetical protein BARRO_50349 [Bartonella rochalimae ATCC BAA-1498]